jgi:DNA-binding NtrC family response regulator
MQEDTLEGSRERAGTATSAHPGLVAVFAASALTWLPQRLPGGALVMGRANVPSDPRLSREHAEICRHAERWTVRDLGSRNGTFVDGQSVHGVVSVVLPRAIRLADSIFVPVDDVGERARPRLVREMVVGASLARALDAVEHAARYSRTLLLSGESGTGKEFAAREFHRLGPNADGPFVALNAATIPSGLAERLLFGTKRGVYSGADADAPGQMQAADKGVLFLDEVAELDLGAQAKLLRVLEAGEVLPLGAHKAQRVDVRVCVATHQNLRLAIAAGRFREDLYYRLTPPQVVLPPLRERLDEIAHHVVDEIAKVSPDLAAHPALVEACLLRFWPGNVRELRREIRQAAAHARTGGGERVRLEHLSPSAGLELRSTEEKRAEPPSPERAPRSGEGQPKGKRRYVRWSESITREQVQRALAEKHGNVTEAARTLGMNRSQLYRQMARWSAGTGSNGAGSG